MAGSALVFHQLVVAEPQSDVRGHHNGVDAVQDDDGVIAVEQLVGDAGGVADENDAEKLEAFSPVVTRCPGFPDGCGPGKSETDQHGDFKYTHNRCLSLYLKKNKGKSP